MLKKVATQEGRPALGDLVRAEASRKSPLLLFPGLGECLMFTCSALEQEGPTGTEQHWKDKISGLGTTREYSSG